MRDSVDFEKRKVVSSWVKIYGDELFSWALIKTNDRVVSEDLVQETFLAAFKSYDSFKGNSRAKTWIFKILNNKIIDFYRKRARSHSTQYDHREKKVIDQTDAMFDKYDNWSVNGLESRWDEEQHLLDDPSFNKVMEECVNNLPESWRTALVWKYRLAKSSKEIRKGLGVTSSNYWQIIHRSKLQLKKCLEVNWFNKE